MVPRKRTDEMTKLHNVLHRLRQTLTALWADERGFLIGQRGEVS